MWLLAPASVLAAPAPEDPFAACDAQVARAPDDLASGRCYYAAAGKTRRFDDARRGLRAALAAHPETPGLLLALANVESDLETDAAEGLYRRAIAAFHARGPARGVVFASLNLANYLGRHERYLDAHAVLAAAEPALAGDPGLTAALRTVEGRLLFQEGRELGRALRLLKEAESIVFPDGNRVSQMQVLNTLGLLSTTLGDLDAALGYFRRQRELSREDPMAEAAVMMRIAGTLLALAEDRPDDARRAEIASLAAEALAAARASGSRFAEATARHHLALVGPEADARAHLEACVEIGRAIKEQKLVVTCLVPLALHERKRSPDTALRLLDEATELARGLGERRQVATALEARALVRWEHAPRELALRDVQVAADAIEAIRDLARDDRSRTLLFANRAGHYHRFAGLLLADHAARGDRAALVDAFALMERLRARALLEKLDAAGATEALVSADTVKRRNGALDAIAAVQRRLQGDEMSAGERSAVVEELRRAEANEAALREELAAADARFAALRRPATVSLDAVAATLAPDEALLSYQLAPWRDLYGEPRGGSWLLVVTRDGVRAHALGERHELEAAARLYVGLVERRDPAEAEGAARLYRELLEPALAPLPASVRRLVVIPDGALHTVPFAALRPRGGAPLMARFDLSLAPSATLWARWRAMPPPRGAREALVYADPELPPPAPGPLPFARAEARRLAELIDADVRLGSEASESSLRELDPDLSAYRLLHFAAHAVVDDRMPERSALLLASGSPTDDGLLQIREIVELPLAGTIVVLSACGSATGQVVAGEGALGLHRAFLQAGARAAVGSLWPLRDDEAAALATGLYRRLRQGERVDRALAGAQLERLRAGAPPAAWAAMVVVGDGAVRPLGRRGASRGWWAAWAAAGVALLAAVGVARVRAPARRATSRAS